MTADPDRLARPPMGEPVVLTEAQIIHDFGMEIGRLRDENTRLKAQVQSLLTTLTQDDFPDPAILHADCRAERTALKAQLADFQRGAAEEARQGDLAREEVHDLKDRLAAALAVVEAARKYRDTHRCNTHFSHDCQDKLALIAALDQLPRTTKETT